MRITILALALMLASTTLKAQYPYTIKDTTRTLLENDSVIIPSPAVFRGTIAWQKSYNRTTWAVVKTASKPDTLAINADSSEIYRLVLTEGSCNPIYTDTITIGEAKNTNKLLSLGFEVDDLLQAGVPLDSMLADNVPVEALLDAGLTPDTLYQSGVSIDELVAAGVSIDELIDANIPLIELYNEGFLVGTLKQHGADSLELVAAGLIGTLRDYHGNVYTWVRIGDQIWMSENLQVGQYRGGTVIQSTNPANTDVSTYPASACRLHWAYNGNVQNAAKYGYLYTWYAVAGDSICPTGWHVPDSMEWAEMINFLGGETIAGWKMKTISSIWSAPNTGSTNESGFNALPGGAKNSLGEFVRVRDLCLFWNANSSIKEIYIRHDAHFARIEDSYFPYQGLSVRCVKN